MLTKRERAAIKCAERRYNFSELFLFLVFRRPHKGLTVLRDIRYGEGKRALLDLVIPEGGGQGSPVFVYIHGGGFVSGRRHNRLYYCYEWADKGYVCANIGYDYALDAAHPEHLRELLTGLDRALTEAEKAGADTSRVVVAGDSAGGYFTAMLAAVSTHPELYEKFGIEFSRQETFRPAACITISGLFDPVRAVGTRFPEMALFTRALLGMSQKEIDEARAARDSVGGIVECRISGVPAGLGDPCFDKLNAALARAVMSIGACKGFEIGEGFRAAHMRGSSYNDEMYVKDGKAAFRTNHSGGILGGISSGETIIFTAAFKPTPSISRTQNTVDRQLNEREIEIHGRHDPCIVPRAVVVVEAMAALTIADYYLRENAYA